jgi:hypothetical protein
MQPFQPILSSAPEHGHDPKHVLNFDQFLKLLKLEEDYFKDEQRQTKLMITRLRKIFYDKLGWDTQLIRRAANIKGRYEVKIMVCPDSLSGERAIISKIKYYRNNEYRPKCRMVAYSNHDRVYGSSRTGKVPFIYQNDHQDVLLPEGYHADLAHTLAGLDAINYPQVVSPLPDYLFFLRLFFPSADSNADVTTWLGDIATTAADFVYFFLRENRPPNDQEQQLYININASASDMLGNIDAFVINRLFDTSAIEGKSLTEIFEIYYCDSDQGKIWRKQRLAVFCDCVGLKDWNGYSFSNEADWIDNYTSQLRNTTAFMVFSSSENLWQKLTLCQQIWKRKYDHIIMPDYLLLLFLTAIKKLL